MKTERKKTSRRQVKRRSNAAYHLMMFPGLFFLILFSYIPMVGILMAFQDFVPAKGLFGSDFVGLKHFIYMIHLPDIGKIIRNTLVIALGKILLGTVMAIAFSILLNEIRIKFLKKRCRPWFTCPISFPGWSWQAWWSTCSAWTAP